MTADREAMTVAVTATGGSRRRRGWLVLCCTLLLGSASTAGTWAAFSATTSNSTTFSTGTLILSNTKDTATACLSTVTNTDVNENDCSAFFTVAVQRPGDTATTDITLQNVGSVDGSALQALAAPACTDADAGGESYHGAGTLCDHLQLVVQEYTSSAARTAGDPTGGSCRYGIDVAPNDGVCDGFDQTKTVATFGTAYPDVNQPLALGAMPSNQIRWFKVSVRFDPAAGNTAQGRSSTFGVRWRVAQ